jgi:putative endonuclease
MAKKAGKFHVYMVRCSDRTLYTGYTNDLENRLKMHNSGKGAKYVRGRTPVKLIYKKAYRTLSSALKAECAVKRLTRGDKLKMIRRGGAA